MNLNNRHESEKKGDWNEWQKKQSVCLIFLWVSVSRKKKACMAMQIDRQQRAVGRRLSNNHGCKMEKRDAAREGERERESRWVQRETREKTRIRPGANYSYRQFCENSVRSKHLNSVHFCSSNNNNNGTTWKKTILVIAPWIDCSRARYFHIFFPFSCSWLFKSKPMFQSRFCPLSRCLIRSLLHSAATFRW